VDTDQRWPVDPVAGEPLALGVRASSSITAVDCEIERGGAVSTVPLTRVRRASRGRLEDGGHLATAQARRSKSAGGWQLTLDELRPHEVIRYQFSGRQPDGTIDYTRRFEVRVAAWRTADDSLVVGHGGNRVLPGSVEVLDDGERIHRVRFALPLAPGEHVSGLGERFDAIDHRGASLDAVVFEQYKNQGAERKTYLPMPFAHIVGGAGWGFHLRTSRRSWFDFGESVADRAVIEVETDAPSDATALLDIAYYTGSPTEVLAAFLDEVGRAESLPTWVFRLWASGNEWNTQAEVLRQAELHRVHEIAVGTIVIEAWSDESTFTAWRDAEYEVREDGAPMRLDDFRFPPDGAWPNPAAMIGELHSRDIRVVLWQIPLMKMRPHPVGQARADAEAAIRENVLIQEVKSDGEIRPYRNRGWWFPLALMPDLSDARAAKWWTEKRRYLVEEMGVDGFKTDGGEHAWGSPIRYLKGMHGDEGNSLFPVHYAKAYGDLLRSAGKAPVTFSRAGFTGSQAHGAFWAGDENSTWDAFRSSMFAGLSAASSGIVYWGWDFAGFSGDIPSAELYLRSAAAATFVPIMQYHSEFNQHRTPSHDRTPWNIQERTGDDRVLPVFRRFAKLRERLVPYLALETRHTLRTSQPLMRPLYFDYPHDELVWEHPLQWMLGRDILVAPVVHEGATRWSVYLPPGRWVDAFTGEPARGGSVIERAVPIDEIPVFVRAEAWPRLGELFAR